MADLSRQQEKCGCEGEQKRERAHWAFLYLSKDATLPSLHLLFWPPGPHGPARLEQRQHFQHRCLNPNAQMHTYISLSLFSCLSFLTPFPYTIAYPQGNAWICRRHPKKHMQTHFLRVCRPRNVAKVVSAAPFIYLCMDMWILTQSFAVTFSAFCCYYLYCKYDTCS